MIWRRLAVGLLVLTLGSCASDGGSSGTGITDGTAIQHVSSKSSDGLTTIQGNVSTVKQTWRGRSPASFGTLLARLPELLVLPASAIADNPVEGITVTVDGTGYGTATDPSGFFSLRGSIGGSAALVFQKSQAGILARLGIHVPSGGVLTLNDVLIDNRSGHASTESQDVTFPAVVNGSDCPSGSLSVASQYDPNGPIFTVWTQGSSLTDSAGRGRSCADLQPGDQVTVRGPMQADGTVGNGAPSGGTRATDSAPSLPSAPLDAAH